MPTRLVLLLALAPAACLFNADTKGLRCTQSSHCQSGQVCSQGTCRSGADEASDSEGTSGSESSGSGG
jgi:hypothetical protein